MALRFLLADDDRDDAELFCEAVKEIDTSIACCCVTNGREAIDKLNREPLYMPDLIFLDINMPEMNGWQCLTSLKGSDTYKNIPVIVYSTSSNKNATIVANDLGALCFFTKPVDYAILKKILETVIFYTKEGTVKFICSAVSGIGNI